jgi:hypothetical protein
MGVPWSGSQQYAGDTTGFFRDFIQSRFGVKVVFGTHPIPPKYYLVHHDLRTWDAPF